MQVKVIWNGRMQFTGVSDDGHQVVMDASPEAGGEGKGIKPTELLLMSAAGCSGINIMLILGKMREQVTDFAVEVAGERRESDPRSFNLIRLLFKLGGEIKPANAERAIRLGLEKYCSVVNSLRAKFVYAYEINGVRYPENEFTPS